MPAKRVGTEYLYAGWEPRVDRWWGWVGVVVGPCLELSIRFRLMGPAGCDPDESYRQDVEE